MQVIVHTSLPTGHGVTSCESGRHANKKPQAKFWLQDAGNQRPEAETGAYHPRCAKCLPAGIEALESCYYTKLYKVRQTQREERAGTTS